MVIRIFRSCICFFFIYGCGSEGVTLNNLLQNSLASSSLLNIVNNAKNRYTNVSPLSQNGNLYGTNGQVNAMLIQGKNLIIGGTFDYVGPKTGSIAIVDNAGFVAPSFPDIRGQVDIVRPDGMGGWFVGGSLNQVNGIVRHGIIHINSDLSFDENWNAQLQDGASIYSIEVFASSIYVGGNFSQIGGQTRFNLAKLDAFTGEADPKWSFDTNAIVTDLEISTGFRLSEKTLFVSGLFQTIQGKNRKNLASIDLHEMVLTDWNPIIGGSIVSDIEVEGDTAYFVGNFASVNASTRINFGAVDKVTGQLRDMNPSPNLIVNCLQVANGKIFIGGYFSNIGGKQINNLAAIDITTGTVQDWSPNPDATVETLYVDKGILYSGGDFKRIGNIRRYSVASFDTKTGILNDWNPKNDAGTGSIASFNNQILYGGTFSSVGGVTRNNLASLDLETGVVTDWDPNVNDTVMTLTATSERIYAGGFFDKIGDESRIGMAAFDLENGKLLTWKADTSNSYYNHVNSIQIQNGIVYFGGDFNSVNGIVRKNLAAVDESSGSVILGWHPETNAAVNSIKIVNSNLYIGGSFTLLNNTYRSRVGAVELFSGRLLNWNPSVSGYQDSFVNTFEVVDSNLFIGGKFNNVSGFSRISVAAVDLNDGSVQPWNQTLWADSEFHFIQNLYKSGSILYIGGQFFSIDGKTKSLAAFENSSTTPMQNWKPNPDGGFVQSIQFSPTRPDDLYIGGRFGATFGETQKFVSRIPLPKP